MISSVGSQIQAYTSTKIASTQKSSISSSSLDKATSPANSTPASTITNLAQEYGSVREISPPAMRELADKLWKSGELSLHEAGQLITTPIEVVRSDSGKIVETRPVQSTDFKFDYIAEMEKSLEWAKNHHEENKIETLQNVLSVLDKLENAMNGRINLAV